MPRSRGEPGDLVGHFSARRVGLLGEAGVAAERERRDPPPRHAPREVGAHLHAPFGQLEKPARVRAIGGQIAAHFVDEPPAKVGRQRRHRTAGALRPGAAGRGKRERAHAGGILRAPATVQPQHQRLRVREVPVEPQQPDAVVGGAVARQCRQRHGDTGRPRQREKARRRIGAHPEPLETERIRRHERGQRLTAPASLQRTEHEQPVGHNRPPHAAAQLVLGVPLVERRLRHAAPGEVAITQPVRKRPLRNIGAAARGRRDQPARELAAGHVVGARHDARRAERVLRHAPRAEREAVERDVVGGGALARDRERCAGGIGLTDPHDAGGERGERVQVGGIDRQAGDDLGREVALRGARRRALHAALRGARADGHRIERYGGHLHLHVGHEAILVRLARDRDPRRGQAEVAHDELILPAAVREEDGEASAGVRGPLA